VYFFCSSAKGPHGHDDEELMFFCSSVIGQSHTRQQAVGSSLLFFFCSNVVNPRDNDEELDSSSSCYFFVQMLWVPKAKTTRSSTPHHPTFFFSNHSSTQ
jgi:hypothetical protein